MDAIFYLLKSQATKCFKKDPNIAAVMVISTKLLARIHLLRSKPNELDNLVLFKETIVYYISTQNSKDVKEIMGVCLQKHTEEMTTST